MYANGLLTNKSHLAAVVGMGLEDVFGADLLLVNGKICTMDSDDSIVEAVAIKGNRIVATGSSVAVKKMARKGAKIIDLNGKTVLPGIIDSHTHPHNAAMNFLEINCRDIDIKRIKDLQIAVSKKAKALGPGKWVRANGYNDSKLA
jgi:predicted amidohydrolase YtcJ